MSNEQVRDSFKRCEAAGDFAETFYGVFLDSSPEVGPLFSNTDFSKQRKLLRASVAMLVAQDIDHPKARETLERIGQSHSQRELDVKPELYEIWLNSLCQTVQKMDPDFDAELERAWRDRMRPGIELITSLY